MKLISMTDFVLEQVEECKFNSDGRFHSRIINYANFLKQPLKLEMFVPCDAEGKVIDAEPCSLGMFEKGNPFYDVYLESQKQWDKAKERVLFEGFNPDRIGHTIDGVFGFYSSMWTIEDLTRFEITLTETAIKQIGL